MNKIYSLLCLSLFSLGLQAQEDLRNEVIDVVKDFRPKVMQAHKIQSQPIFLDTSKVSENLAYHIRFEEFRLSQQIDSLEAMLADRPNLADLYTKRVELGLGTLLTPNISMEYMSGRNTKSTYQAYAHYEGAHGNNLALDETYNETLLGANYKRVFSAFTIQSGLEYLNRGRKDLFDSSFQDANLGFNSTFQLTKKKLVLIPEKVQFSYASFWRNASSFENTISIDAMHSGEYDKLESWSWGNSLVFQNSLERGYVHWITSPQTSFKKDLSRIHITLDIDVLNDNLSEQKVKLLPNIRAQYQLIENALFAYAEFGSSREVYSISDLTSKNPYLIDFHPDSATTAMGMKANTKYFLRAGINGNLFRGVGYQLSADWSSQDAYAHFVHYNSDFKNGVNGMNPDFVNLQMLTVHAEIDAKCTEDIHLWLKGDIRSFDKHLSYVPEMELGLYARYHYNDQWSLLSSLNYVGEREALTYYDGLFCYKETAEELPAFMDFNLKATFAFNKQMGFYIEGTNLLNEDYILWEGKPVLGRQLHFGASYRF